MANRLPRQSQTQRTAAPMRQYFTNKTISGGGPVERVAKLNWSTDCAIPFLQTQGITNTDEFLKYAVNVVCRDNHVLNNIPLFVFLYDERSGSVYSGRHTVSTQDPRKRSVHAVDVPMVDREASTTVLVTGILSLITDDALKSAIDKLDNGRRPVQNIKRLRNEEIAFVQFQHHEGELTTHSRNVLLLEQQLNVSSINPPDRVQTIKKLFSLLVTKCMQQSWKMYVFDRNL
ncbi:hypothetical protein BaRGS_00030226 [Batillaria attramentaria]|uniref:Uncharacterized protein n=1 Tax=Batillaria attramentaria TaxID=370345 RepID=A0ABD0JV46_9CAEN